MKKTKTLTRAEMKRNEEIFKADLKKQQDYNAKMVKKYLESDPDQHKFPTTRRDFLEVGLYSTVGWMLGPTIDQLLLKTGQAHAADCPTPDVNGPAAFIHVHASGGIASLAQFVPTSNPNANFRSLGLGQDPTGNLARLHPNGGVQFYDYGNDGQGRPLGLYRGILSVTSQETRNRCTAIGVTVRDNGDSSDPVCSIMGLVERAGRAGSKLVNMGSSGAATGAGNAPNPVFAVAPTQPLRVRRVQDILQAVQAAGALQNLSQPQQIKLAETIKNLSIGQARSITSLNGGAKVADLVECATDQVLKNTTEGAGNIDPTQVAGMSDIWNNFQSTDYDGRNDTDMDGHAAMVMNVCNGNAAACAIQVGGYDIHNNANRGRTFQEGITGLIGQQIGRCLETARFFQTKVFIYLTTNGSNNNQTGQIDGAFNSDSSSYSGRLCIAADFTPGGSAPVLIDDPFVGNLQDNGSVNRNVVTISPENSAAAAFYNYCIFSGIESKFDEVVGANRFDAQQKNFMRRLQV